MTLSKLCKGLFGLNNTEPRYLDGDYDLETPRSLLRSPIHSTFEGEMPHRSPYKQKRIDYQLSLASSAPFHTSSSNDTAVNSLRRYPEWVKKPPFSSDPYQPRFTQDPTGSQSIRKGKQRAIETEALVHALTKENEKLKEETNQLKKSLDSVSKKHLELAQMVESMMKRQEQAYAAVEESQSRARQFEEHLGVVESRKTAAETALAELRQFLSTGDAGDVGDLVKKVEDLNEEIDELAFLASGQLENAGRSITVQDIGSLHDLLPALRPILQSFPGKLKGDPVLVDEFASTLMKSLVCAILSHQVFEATFRSLKEIRGPLASIYGTLRETEPQAIFARWRSLTYSAVDAIRNRNKSEEDRIKNSSKRILVGLNQVFRQLDHSPSPAHELSEDCLSRLSHVVSAAFSLHKTIHRDYLSADFSVFLPSHSNPFDATSMIDIGQSEAGTKEVVVSTGIGFGLKKSVVKRASRGGDQSELSEVVVKAQVLTSTSQ